MSEAGALAVPAERKPNLRQIARDNAGYGIIAVSLLLLWILDPGQLPITVRYVVRSAVLLSPLLVATFGLNAYLIAADANSAVMRVFDGRVSVMIVSSTLLGALSPLCSCTVVPMIAVLLQAGVPLGPIMAFWMASPLVAPETFTMTAALLGLPFATARLVTAIAVGLLAGFATEALQRLGYFKRPIHPRLLLQGIGQSFALSAGRVKPRWRFWTVPERRTVFRKEFLRSANLMTTWLVVAFLLESVLGAYAPSDVLLRFFGTQSAYAIPVAAFAGMPVYINGVAALPLVKAFVDTGMSPGAALAFIVGGSATSLPAMFAVLPLVRRPVFIWYLVVAWVGAILSGYAYQVFLALAGS